MLTNDLIVSYDELQSFTPAELEWLRQWCGPYGLGRTLPGQTRGWHEARQRTEIAASVELQRRR